jgi:hypothetical protein
VGIAVVQPANDEGLRAAPGTVWGELLFLAVAEGQRGRGLGAALLRVAEERYAAAGYLSLMVTMKPEMAGWYAARGWTTLPSGLALAFTDLRRGNAADAAGRSASYYWTTPTDREYSVWAWRALDPERPVTAWAADPEHRQPGLQDVGRIAAELERQESFGLGRVPADLRALAARAKDSGGSQDQPPRARW